MLIIFGLRDRVAILATISLACRNGHVAAHRILKVTRWLTLFFIPLIPYSSKRRSVCIQCGLTLDIPKAAAEELATAPGARHTGEPVTPPLPQTDSNPLPPAGWYADPLGSGGARYWDGQRWTEAVTPSHFPSSN